MLPGPVTRSTGSQRRSSSAPCAVGEHRDRLGAADRVHLVDAEQRAGGEDRRVRQAAELRAAAGEATASEPTPATWAGTTFITTLDGYATRPPGT